jgi:hypothetical protein
MILAKQSADYADGTDYKELALLIDRIGVICGYIEMLETQTLTNQTSPRRFTETKFSLSRISREWYVGALCG